MKMSTAKTFLSFLMALVLIVSLTVFASIPIRNTGEEDSAAEYVTAQLDSSWTTIYEGTLPQTTDLAVTNSASGFYDVEVRLLSDMGTAFSERIQTISSGYCGTFSAVPAGNYTIQARSADGVVREYTLKLAE